MSAMESVVEEQQSFGTMIFHPVSVVLQFLASYGWYVVGTTAVGLYILNKLKNKYEAYRQAREDAEYHKDPDKLLGRMERIQRARERQQELFREASRRAREVQKELAERKRAETIERLKKYGTATVGRRLGDADDETSYLPLSGGASTSTYRPPKKKCPGGGCGR